MNDYIEIPEKSVDYDFTDANEEATEMVSTWLDDTAGFS